MKFIFADCLDLVDPTYDFIEDRSSPNRKVYWDDVYPHEILGYAPYSGILVSRGIVEGKYNDAQAMRFRRVGAREFLRLDRPNFANLAVFGDCGAFSYVKDEKPPYTPENMIEFYGDCGFTHGCSVDHIIFDFDPSARGMDGGSEEARRRFDITLDNAEVFLRASVDLGKSFTPLGVIQAWSPDSMAEAARRLVAMGYQYLAVGGMVPLQSPQIQQCLEAIRSSVPTKIQLHILGFAKANDLPSFVPYDITSFDTTSPLIRAFKDTKENYYLPVGQQKLRYFTAIRVPQSTVNLRLNRLVKRGVFHSEDLTAMEKHALQLLRAYDDGESDLHETLEAVMNYNAPFIMEKPYEEVKNASKLRTLKSRYQETLSERPWKKCQCSICQQISIEVIIFRAANRNRRRGIHNLSVFSGLVDTITKQGKKHE